VTAVSASAAPSTTSERPPIIVVDNDSGDGTASLVKSRWPEVRVIRLDENLGAAGRNVGVRAAGTPYVAFAEDDSWYEPGALARAADVLDDCPDVGLINAHVLVGPDRRDDPVHADMVDSPLPDDPDRPGYRIASFLEGVSVVRRTAFLQAGGFDARLGIGGPEEHLAAELMRHGWELRYVPDVVARHCPDHGEPSAAVRRLGLRNTLWFAWRVRPVGRALRWTAHVLRDSGATKMTLGGLCDAVRGLPHVLRERDPLPSAVERDMARLDEPKRRSEARRYRSGARQG
jgi:GT2 family glycosyltransferase